MSARATSSFSWLIAAVLLPLIVLATMAVAGMRSQTKAIRNEVLEDASREARAAASFLAHEFSAHHSSFPAFPDPPLPGLPSPDDAILEGEDLTALLALRDKPDAGTSPAGLPRRALAAMRVMLLSPRMQDPSALASLFTRESPSVLTGRALAEIGGNDPLAGEWRELGTARDLLRKHPEGGWLQADGGLWWVGSKPDSFDFISPARAKGALEKAAALINPRFLLRMDTADAAPLSEETPLLFATAPVGWGERLKLEVHLKSADEITAGVRRQQLWTLSLLGVAVGVSVIGLFLIHRTLRRERKLNEMKSQFVASVSHELRAPVASIRLMADALEEGKVAPGTAKEFHRLIAREGARLSTLVGNVLDHARIEQGRKVWKMESCDLAALVAETLRVMEPLAAEKHLRLLSSLGPVEAAIDAGAIQQALVNLLDNAIKFSPPGKSIGTTLAIHDESRTWTLAVSDEGSGIPAEEQPRIFERFYRPGDELRRETQGTGIGLSLVKSIAGAHGGTVTVDSGPGHGSTFTLRIPISS